MNGGGEGASSACVPLMTWGGRQARWDHFSGSQGAGAALGTWNGLPAEAKCRQGFFKKVMEKRFFFLIVEKYTRCGLPV